MSFVYAKKCEKIIIMSDTKVGLNEEMSELWRTGKDRQLVERVGIIKSIIVSPSIVVSFAGNNINKVAELLRKIDKENISFEAVVCLAEEIHKKADKNEIEFIVAYSDEEKQELVSIKDNKVIRDCEIAYLGSYDAYKQFKRLERESLSRRKVSVEKYIEEGQAYIDTQSNFRKVVELGKDKTVGGIPVCVSTLWGNSSFQYMEALSSQAGLCPQVIQKGESIKTLQGTKEGSFSYIIYQSSKEFCCYFMENNMGIIFSDETILNDGLKGLMMPKVYKMSKEDFDDIAKEKGSYSGIVVNWE